MIVLNERVVHWLESGEMRQALLGEGNFFLLDHTSRDKHDVVLVMYVLICWAHKVKRVKAVGDELSTVLLQLCDVNPKACADILLTYAIVSRGIHKQLPVDFSLVFHNLEAVNAKDTQPIVSSQVMFELQKILKKIGC